MWGIVLKVNVFLLYYLLARGSRRIHCVFQGADRASVPSLSPFQPPIHCGTCLGWMDDRMQKGRKGLSISNSFASQLSALHVFLSCLIILFFLTKETLIRGYYVLSWITCHEALYEFSSVHSTSKWWLLRNCCLDSVFFFISHMKISYSVLNTLHLCDTFHLRLSNCGVL